MGDTVRNDLEGTSVGSILIEDTSTGDSSLEHSLKGTLESTVGDSVFQDTTFDTRTDSLKSELKSELNSNIENENRNHLEYMSSDKEFASNDENTQKNADSKPTWRRKITEPNTKVNAEKVEKVEKLEENVENVKKVEENVEKVEKVEEKAEEKAEQKAEQKVEEKVETVEYAQDVPSSRESTHNFQSKETKSSESNLAQNLPSDDTTKDDKNNIPKSGNYNYNNDDHENSVPLDTFKNSMTDKDGLDSQIKFFKKFSRDNVVTIVQANSGYVEILSNMFCTLLATNPNYLKGLVVWTTDMEFGSSWLNHMRNSHSHSPLSTHFMNDFGVYYSTALAEKSVNASKVASSGSKEYYKLMNLRGEFFVFMLEQIGMPFIFLDGDMVFFRDPFPWITANDGLGLGAGEGADRATVLGQKSIGLNFKKWGDLLLEREPSLKNYLGFEGDFKYMGPNNPEWVEMYTPSSQDRKKLIEKMEMISKNYRLASNPKLGILKQDPFLMLPPDLVYATDPHHPPAYNSNPYLGSGDAILNQIPKICGGTFYVKPNNRTINLFKLLLKEIENGGNDQWSMDKLLNQLDAVLVGQLPRCVGRSGKDHYPFCPEKGIFEPPARTSPLPLPTTQTLRVRVLEFWQFSTNAALYYGPGDGLPRRQEKAFFFTKMFSSYSYLKEDNVAVPYHVPVAFHANAWNKDKIRSLKAAASWYLDEKGVCNIV